MDSKDMQQPLILFAMTVAQSLPFYKGQMSYLRTCGYRVAALSSPGDFQLEGIDYYTVPMSRAITPLKDVVSLYKLVKLFKKVKPTIVSAGTPKAGLLCMMAAYLSGVPIRIYSSHGFRFETLKGLKRKITMMTERLSVLFSTKVFCVSGSLKEKFATYKLAPESKTILVHNGTCCGVDSRKFARTNRALEEAAAVRRKFNIPPEAKVIGFTGRFIQAKGIQDLIDAFLRIKTKDDNLYLLLCGDYEDEGDSVDLKYKRIIAEHPFIKHTGYVSDVVPYFHSMDLFVFPSYREGFSTVLLEASAASLPVISTYATGCIDAVIEGVTGLLVPAGKLEDLVEAIQYVLVHPLVAGELAERGRERVERDFRPADVWREHEKAYRELIAASGGKMLTPLTGENVRI